MTKSDQPNSEQEQQEQRRKFDQEQYERLVRCLEKMDLSQWNNWRTDHPEVEILLQGAILGRVNLCDADLRSANLQGAELGGANLQNADLRSADLQGANLEGADLQEAIIYGTKLQGATLIGVKLRGTGLTDVNLRNTDLHCADLGDASLAGIDLQGANLNRTELRGASLSNSNLQDADLRSANLQDANLGRANLRNADLRSANLQGASLRAANLQGANLEGANLQKAHILDANMKGANLKDADLERADLVGCRGIVFDSTYILNTRHIPKNPWHRLRNQYTGVKLVLHLILLATFILIYSAKAMFWCGMAKGQTIIINELASLESRYDEESVLQDPNESTAQDSQVQKNIAGAISKICGELREKVIRKYQGAKGAVNDKFQSFTVWQILLSQDKKIWFQFATLVLIVYNVLRYLLTQGVAPLSVEEDRSHYTPRLSHYGKIVWFHKVNSVLWVFALASYAIHCYDWMTANVLMPK